jgi:hypothetical protein
LLEVFRDLEIHGARSKLTSFLAQFVKALPPGWKRDIAREKEIGRWSEGRQFVFHVTAQNGRPAARIFILVRDETLKITNVVPDKSGRLTRSEYNSFFEQFDQIASPIARKLGLVIHMTSNQRNVGELLSSDALAALRAFSGLANKSGAASSFPTAQSRSHIPAMAGWS